MSQFLQHQNLGEGGLLNLDPASVMQLGSLLGVPTAEQTPAFPDSNPMEDEDSFELLEELQEALA